MLNELSKSGTTASDTFKEAAGMTFPEYIAAGHSTTEAIGLLAEAAKESGKSVSDVFGSAEAGKAANVLVAHADDATTALDNMRTMSGQTESAFTTMNETTAVKMEKLKTSLQNIAITLGETILPVITPVIEKVTNGIQMISEKFQALSPGGAISYVEVPDMQDNLEAVLSVMRFIYDNIMYAELNTKSDYCQVCGFDGEIRVVEDDGKLVWECPNCGNRDERKMNVCRRVCGYLGVNYFNQGRTAEIAERVLHL